MTNTKAYLRGLALGLMMGAIGLGALVGALGLARRKSVIGLGRVIAIATTGFGLALIAFSFSKLFWLSLLLLTGVGMGWMVQIAACNTALQTLADDAMRGRVMSLFSMMLVGMAPFGSLIAGWASDRISRCQPSNAMGIDELRDAFFDLDGHVLQCAKFYSILRGMLGSVR